MPLYENDYDRNNKQRFMERFNTRPNNPLKLLPNPDDGKKLENTPDYYAIAYEKQVGAVEFKRRTHNFGRWPDVVIDKGKLDCLMSFAKEGKVGAFYVQYKDGSIYAYFANPFHLESGQITFNPAGGRTRNTRDEHDVEPVYNIPITLLKPINF